MGIREKLNQQPGLTALVALILVGVALYVTYRSSQEPELPVARTKAFFSVDDGKNLFESGISRRAPFEHEGHQAVRAHVYSCDNGKTRFVGYLEKYKDEFIAKMNAPSTQPAGGFGPGPGTGPEEVFARLVKRPGDSEWHQWASMEGQKIVSITCPDGKGELLNVLPENDR